MSVIELEYGYYISLSKIIINLKQNREIETTEKCLFITTVKNTAK